jgi:hypothetical protein
MDMDMDEAEMQRLEALEMLEAQQAAGVLWSESQNEQVGATDEQ